MAGRMTFQRAWDFDPSNKPVTLNDLRFDDETRAIILGMVPGGGGGGAVDSVNGETGAVVLTQDDVGDGAIFGQYALTERAKLAGIAAGATVNSSDSALRDRATHTGSQSLDTTTDSGTRIAMTPAERTKLTGVATGATANDTDANLKARANHTGTQLASTISDFNTAADARITAANLQPSDADLTAIAALATTAYGRAFLTLANQAALVALLPSYQPLDADLTSIAALSTTAYGRAFLALADQAALMGLIPQATETVAGKAEIATSAEITAGTSDTVVVTPLKLEGRIAAIPPGSVADASETVKGAAELATQTEVNTGTDDLRIVTPLKLATRLTAVLSGYQPVDSDLTAIAALATNAYGRGLLTATNANDVASYLPAATELLQGIAEIATQTEVNTGTDDSRIVTALKLQTRMAAYAQPLDSDLTSIAALSTTTFGRALLTLADSAALAAQVAAASTTAAGVVELATTAEVTTGTDTVRAVTPAGAAANYARNAEGGLEKVVDLGATAGALSLNADNGSVFLVQPNGNITGISVTNLSAVSATTAATITLIVQQNATVRTVATPTNGVWLGSAPTQVASKACVITMMTTDGGTTWYCSGVVQA